MLSEEFDFWLQKQINLAFEKASNGEYHQAILIELETIRTILLYYVKPKKNLVGQLFDKLKKALHYFK
jgi:hypothetical protein